MKQGAKACLKLQINLLDFVIIELKNIIATRSFMAYYFVDIREISHARFYIIKREISL